MHLGLDKGDRVGIWSPNHYEWIVAQFATALAGLVLVTISLVDTNSSIFQVNVNPMYKSADLAYAIGKVGVKALIASPSFKKHDYYSILRDILPELENTFHNHGSIYTNKFPHLKHLIIFDKEDRDFR